MRKLFTNHIIFIEKMETLLFCFVSLLTLGYWRNLVTAYGWRFFAHDGWWLRFVIAALLSVFPLVFGDGAWNKLREIMRPYDRRYGIYGAPLITRELNEPKTTKDWLNFAKNVLLTAIAVWIVVFAPLSDQAALACYIVSIITGLALALFALIMALKDYCSYRSSR